MTRSGLTLLLLIAAAALFLFVTAGIAVDHLLHQLGQVLQNGGGAS